MSKRVLTGSSRFSAIIPGNIRAIGAKASERSVLVGPPGTGKTLLAKAVAGEAKVPFFSLSGSAFVGNVMWVMEHPRVRDLFKQAQQMAPVSFSLMRLMQSVRAVTIRWGGNDEREQTLNQLLARWMDLRSNKGLVLCSNQQTGDPGSCVIETRTFLTDESSWKNHDLKGRVEVLKVHSRCKDG